MGQLHVHCFTSVPDLFVCTSETEISETDWSLVLPEEVNDGVMFRELPDGGVLLTFAPDYVACCEVFFAGQWVGDASTIEIMPTRARIAFNDVTSTG